MTQRAVTSASNIFRRRECPGSAAAEMGILDEESDYSNEGTLLHRLVLHRIVDAATAVDVPSAVVLTQDQAEALNEAERLFKVLLAEVCAALGISSEEPFTDECERELIVRDAVGQTLYPGHADLIRHWPAWGYSLIVDFKFGFADVDEAPDNTQLASYAVAHSQEKPVERVAVAIIQPRNFGPRITRALYEASALDAARDELARIVLASREPNAPRIAGTKQCAHCKARLFCDSYKAKLLPAARGVRDVALLSNDDLWKYQEACSLAAAIRSKVSAELRRRIQAGECEGSLQSTGSTKKVTDPIALYNRLRAMLPDRENLAAEVMSCAAISLPALSEKAADWFGLPKKKARAKVEEIGGGLIESEEKAPTPVR